jgi:hypothetical protein
MTTVFPKEYLYYNYTPQLKDYVRTAVRQRFKNVSITTEDLLSFIKELRESILFEFLSSLNIPITQTYVEIFYQMSLIVIIDNIKQQKYLSDEFLEPVKIKYNDLNAITPYSKYDCSWFPTGLYILPKILSELITNKIITIVYYLLRDNTQALRFSLTKQDEIYGDMAPNVLYCIYKGIYELLNEKFIMLFEKKKLLITNTTVFSMNKIDPLTEEVVFLFTRHATMHIGKNLLTCPSGSIVVLNKEALANTIKISALENSTVLIFF